MIGRLRSANRAVSNDWAEGASGPTAVCAATIASIPYYCPPEGRLITRLDDGTGIRTLRD